MKWLRPALRSPPEPRHPCRVAVVDDDDAVRRALGRLLRVTGHQVRTYASAEEFLGAAPSGVDCLVLDV